MTDGIIDFVNEQDLAEVVIEVPGDGHRMMMCLLMSYHDAGADGCTIVAMADDLKTLASRVRETGLKVKRQPADWSQLYPWTKTFGGDLFWGGEEILVVDLPPNAVRGLCLESHKEMLESIERMRTQQHPNAIFPD